MIGMHHAASIKNRCFGCVAPYSCQRIKLIIRYTSVRHEDDVSKFLKWRQNRMMGGSTGINLVENLLTDPVASGM